MPDPDSQAAGAPEGRGRKVLVIGSFPPTLILFRGPLLRAMRARGHQVVAAASAEPGSAARELAAMGIEYRALPLQRTGLNPVQDLQTLFAIWRLCRGLRPDVVLAYAIKPVVWGSSAAWLAGVPQQFSLIDGLGYAFGETTHGRRRILRSAAQLLYRLALALNERVFFLNPDDYRLFLTEGVLGRSDRGVVVDGSGVDLERFRPAPLPDVPSFLMISRLLGEKGVRDYVAAARQLRCRFPAARCRLVGWIDETPDAISASELEQWVAEGDIDYQGRLDDVRPAIAASSVIVLPSTYREGVPQSLLEGMAMGRALITTDRPGCRETVRQGINGLLVPPRDFAALAGAMASLVETPTSLLRWAWPVAGSRRTGSTSVRSTLRSWPRSACKRPALRFTPLPGPRRVQRNGHRLIEQRGQPNGCGRRLPRVDQIAAAVMNTVLERHEGQEVAKPCQLAALMTDHEVGRNLVRPDQGYEQVGPAIVDLEQRPAILGPAAGQGAFRDLSLSQIPGDEEEVSRHARLDLDERTAHRAQERRRVFEPPIIERLGDGHLMQPGGDHEPAPVAARASAKGTGRRSCTPRAADRLRT